MLKLLPLMMMLFASTARAEDCGPGEIEECQSVLTVVWVHTGTGYREVSETKPTHSTWLGRWVRYSVKVEEECFCVPDPTIIESPTGDGDDGDLRLR